MSSPERPIDSKVLMPAPKVVDKIVQEFLSLDNLSMPKDGSFYFKEKPIPTSVLGCLATRADTASVLNIMRILVKPGDSREIGEFRNLAPIYLAYALEKDPAVLNFVSEQDPELLTKVVEVLARGNMARLGTKPVLDMISLVQLPEQLVSKLKEIFSDPSLPFSNRKELLETFPERLFGIDREINTEDTQACHSAAWGLLRDANTLVEIGAVKGILLLLLENRAALDAVAVSLVDFIEQFSDQRKYRNVSQESTQVQVARMGALSEIVAVLSEKNLNKPMVGLLNQLPSCTQEEVAAIFHHVSLDNAKDSGVLFPFVRHLLAERTAYNRGSVSVVENGQQLTNALELATQKLSTRQRRELLAGEVGTMLGLSISRILRILHPAKDPTVKEKDPAVLKALRDFATTSNPRVSKFLQKSSF